MWAICLAPVIVAIVGFTLILWIQRREAIR